MRFLSQGLMLGLMLRPTGIDSDGVLQALRLLLASEEERVTRAAGTSGLLLIHMSCDSSAPPGGGGGITAERGRLLLWLRSLSIRASGGGAGSTFSCKAAGCMDPAAA